MLKARLIISISIFVTFLVITSAIKNKTRILEKQMSNLHKLILIKEKNINEAELDFYYLSSPAELEKKINLLGFNDYQPIKYSNIYFDISDFYKIQNKLSNLNNLNDKKIQKK